MVRRLTLAITVVVLLFGLIAVQRPAQAAMTITGKVLVSRLHLRNSASVKGMSVLILKHNDIVTVIGRSPHGFWLKVQTSTGIVGWVSRRFVRLIGGKLNSLPAVQ